MIQLLPRSKEVSGTNQHFCEPKQCRENNLIQKIDHVNRPSDHQLAANSYWSTMIKSRLILAWSWISIEFTPCFCHP